MSAQSAPPKQADIDRKEVDRVIIRFAGDSGDGMQLTGDRFTSVSAVFGNDLATMPDFPAEIRAPAGTLAGVSAFQILFADYDILTPGDQPGVLVAMNLPPSRPTSKISPPAGSHREHRRLRGPRTWTKWVRDQPAG